MLVLVIKEVVAVKNNHFASIFFFSLIFPLSFSLSFVLKTDHSLLVYSEIKKLLCSDYFSGKLYKAP